MNTVDLQIRLADTTDALKLARRRFALRASSHKTVEEEADFIARCEAWMQERLRSDGSWKCWIAESQGTLVGSIWAQSVEKIPNPIAEPEQFVYISNFFVDERYRDKGIGTRLLSAVLEWSRGKTVILWPSTLSQSLYRRNGFSSDGPMEWRS